ncbi:transposase [Haloferula sargassicola]|uniref:Transposase IS200-like domain-containing protein n=1 Tax=Haloferula sargassicola TaxID=490096 RepID=A0ABP9UHL8_9BACT
MPDWSALHFFRRGGELDHCANRLPHWQQEQSCLFLTFRLADSLPAHLLKRFGEERDAWLQFHPRPWNPATEMEYHRRFSATLDRWLDAGHGSCVLRQVRCQDCLRSVFTRFDGDRYLQHAFVIMPNHVHLLFSLAEKADLSSLVRAWKSTSARRIHQQVGGNGNLWQKDYFDRLVRGPQHFAKIARYLRKNRDACPHSFLHEAPWLTEWLDS